MVINRSEGLAKLLVLCQLLLAAAVFWTCSVITYHVLIDGVPSPIRRQAYYCAVLLFGLGAEAFARDSAKMKVRLLGRSPFHSHSIAFRQTVFGAVALLAYLAACKDVGISRTLLALLFPSLYLTLVAADIFVPRWLARHIFFGVREERTLIVGLRHRVPEIAPWLACKAAMGFRTLGLVCDPSEDGSEPEGMTRLGSLDEIGELVVRHRPTQLLLLEIPGEPHLHRRLIEVAEHHGLRLLILNTLAETLDHPVVHFEDDGCQLIGVRQEPLENPLNRGIKRLLDIAVALPAVVVVLPLLSAVIWLFQRRQSPGPLFFLQERAGIQNYRFHLVKFRTMHPSNNDAARQATCGDERIYPAGRWLRKLSLDEIPQFWNVLIGEMSVVGPRPHMIEHNVLFASQLRGYHTRSFVKPGITGLAQVNGFRGEIRSGADLTNRLRADLTYLENWTLGTDLIVIFRTAWQVLFPHNSAY